MQIDGKEYRAEGAYNDVLSIPDCWVATSNKIGKGHGEGKLYYGVRSRMDEVFSGDVMSVKCFVLKSDLLTLAEALKPEYTKPKEKYQKRKDFPNLYAQRLDKIEQLPDDPLTFDIHFQKQIKGTRGYINSSSKIYNLLREIALPNLCFLSIMRLINVDDPKDVIYYWKIYVDLRLLWSKDRKMSHAERYGRSLDVGNRPGQATYRKKLIVEFEGRCAVTNANELEVLVASHIKPYKAASREEKVDPNNGILLSSLYDRLFDRGFITFDEKGLMLTSSWLSSDNQQRLHVPSTVATSIPLNPQREAYLQYHRKFIYKGQIN